MGDRTWLTIRVAVSDVDAVNELADGSGDEEMASDGCIDIFFQEMNWGGDDFLRLVAKKRIPFSAEHGPGGQYGYGTFASVDGVLVSCESSHGSYPVIEVREGGIPDFKQLGRVMEYWETYERMADARAERGSGKKKEG